VPAARPSTSRSDPAGAGAGAARLEVHEAEGALETVEAFLLDHGFFRRGGERLVADLHLGYRLAATLRRTGTPSPPEPCVLPAAACVVRPACGNALQVPAGPFRIGSWRRSWQPDEYARAVARVREAIARGDVYQVNLVQHLSAPFSGDPVDVAAALAPLAPLVPRPLLGEGWAVVSASPERFLSRRGSRVWTSPIKGTRPAGRAAELSRSEKDAAEHLMIVDLERNDLARVCRAGTVRWPELMATRRLAGVEHMVSTVEGTLRDGVGLAELLAATFPGGSVTGAPKIAAVDVIAALEPVGRGASMGAVGTIRGNGDLDLALTIRTFAIAEERIHLWVGGGIVWDSDAVAEVAESLVKAQPLLALLRAPLPEAGP
jgi:para-aminobenzoate synthetase component I